MEGFGSSFNKVKIDAEMSERDLHFNDLRQTAATKFYIAGFTATSTTIKARIKKLEAKERMNRSDKTVSPNSA